MTTIFRKDKTRITIAEAKSLVLKNLPKEEHGAVYGRITPEGEIDADSINVVLEVGVMAAPFIDRDFPDVCASLGIVPIMRIRPSVTGFPNTPSMEGEYNISHDEFAKLAERYGLIVEIGQEVEHPTQPQTETSAPVVTDQTPLPVFTVQARPLCVPPELMNMNPADQIRFIDRVGTMHGDGIGIAGDLLEVIRATISRQASGYFTLDEASQILSDATGSPVKTQLEKLRRAIAEKALHALDQDDKMPVLGAVRNFLSVLRVSDMAAAGFAFPNAPQPAPVVTSSKHTTKRRTWRDVALPYVVDIFKAGNFTTAKALYLAIEKKAGTDSPFERGTGDNRAKLVVRELSETVGLKTIQNAWADIKALR